MQDLFNRNLTLRRKVLVVDDELINRELLGNIISSDYEVLYAADGIEAMNLIHKHEQTLSLIMLVIIGATSFFGQNDSEIDNQKGGLI